MGREKDIEKRMKGGAVKVINTQAQQQGSPAPPVFLLYEVKCSNALH